MEVVAQAVLDEIRAANEEFRKSVDGLDGDGLNWRPATEGTNSLFVLGSHMVGVQRMMVSTAVGATIERDRSEEFRAVGQEGKALLQTLERAEVEVAQWLESIISANLQEIRTYLGREVSVARCLAIATRHLGEHAGHAGLTRQLWDQRVTPTIPGA